MNKTNEGGDKKKGCLFLTMVLIVIMIVGMSWFLMSMISGNGISLSLPDFNFKIGRVLLILFISFLANIALAFGAIKIAIKEQWKILLWIDKRLLPMVKGKKENRSKIIEKFLRFVKKVNPDNLDQAEQEYIPLGSFRKNPGEVFLGPKKLWFRNWALLTASPIVILSIRNAIVISFVSTIAILINFELILISLSLSLFSMIFIAFSYWKKEWERLSGFVFITNHRFGFGEGQFSWPGLLFNVGVDASINDPLMDKITNFNVDPVPKDVDLHPVIEALVEIFHDDPKQGTGTLTISIMGNNTFDNTLVFSNLDYAQSIELLIKDAKEEYRDFQDRMRSRRQTKNRFVDGIPGKKTDPWTREELAEEWSDKASSYLNEGETFVNVFDIKMQYLEKMASLSQKSSNSSSETPQVSGPSSEGPKTPLRFPGEEI